MQSVKLNQWLRIGKQDPNGHRLFSGAYRTVRYLGITKMLSVLYFNQIFHYAFGTIPVHAPFSNRVAEKSAKILLYLIYYKTMYTDKFYENM